MTTQTNESKAAAKLPVLHLIRHGETAWSLSGQHTGRTDLPLLPSGVEQARLLAPRLRHITFSQILTSPRLRARETCALAGLGESPEITPDLAEWDYGDYEGLLAREINQRQPGWNIYRDGCPNGESPAQISDRADRLIARLRELRGNLALFSHGHFSRVLAVRWVRLPVTAASHLLISTASLSILTFEQSLTRPVIALWNWRSEP